MKDDLLSAHQQRIAERVIDEESTRREHVVVYLSGAHAYGFPSPDSDLDLKAIHIEPTRSLLGLTMPVLTFDRAEVIEDVEIDYTSNEISTALAGILQGNGNFLERVLGRTAVRSSPTHDELALKGLDKAHAGSKLPEEPHDPELFQAWLVGARRSRLN